MALSQDTYTGDGVEVNYTVNFGYISTDHVLVYVDGVLVTNYSWTGVSTITFDAAPADTLAIVIDRDTPTDPTELTVFTDGNPTIPAADLNRVLKQAMYVAEEAVDDVTGKLSLNNADAWDAELKRIVNGVAPLASTDLATKGYVDGVALGTLGSPLDIADGGTGSATEGAARTALSVARPVQSKSTDYTMTTDDRNAMLRWSATGTYTLLAADTATNDFQVDLYADGGDITVDPDASELINGSATLTVSDGESGTLFCTGSAWYFLRGSASGGGGHWKGNNGEKNDTNTGDIFRINGQTLTSNVTIGATENASCAGPLAIQSGVNLTITSGGRLVIV